MIEDNEKDVEEWTRKDAAIAIIIVIAGIVSGTLLALFLGLLG